MDELRDYLERGEEEAAPPSTPQEGAGRPRNASFRIPLPTITGVISFMGQVWCQVWGQVWGQVWSQVRSLVTGNH